VGFGLAENGGMRGADMFLYEADSDTLTDAHVLGDLYPLIDSCQNWELQYSQTHGGVLIVEVSRLLDTGDTQDHKIINDTELLMELHFIISAWGDSPTVSYHGRNNRAKGALRFYGKGLDEWDMFEESMDTEAEGSFFVGAEDYPIPSRDTKYKRFCFDETHFVAMGVPMNQSLHVIGIKPVIDPRTAKYVHHFTVTTNEGGSCDTGMVGTSIYGWAPGGLPLSFPPIFGSPLGADGFTFYSLTIHYNNPDLEEGMLDSSGIQLYWTTQKREQEVGGFILADPQTALKGHPVGGGVSKHVFDCPASCTTLTLTGLKEPITVFKEQFHMHQTGIMASNSIIRNGEVVHSTNVQFFDFEQSGSIGVQQETFQILPGDSFRSTCYYDSPNDGHKFGLSSQEEMCLTSLAYYPRQKLLGRFSLVCAYDFVLPQCKANYSSSLLASTADLKRKFGLPAKEGTVCLPESVEDAPTVAEKESEDDDNSSGNPLSCWMTVLGVLSLSLFLILQH